SYMLTNLNLGGMLTGSDSLTVSGTMTWPAGGMTGSGKTTLLPGATGTISSGQDKTLGRQIEIAGAVQWLDGRIFGQNSSVTITPTGTLDIQCDRDFYDTILRNNGTITKSAGTGGTTFRPVYSSVSDFANAATVRVLAGALHFASTGTNAGNFESASGASVYFEQGQHAFNQASFSGSGGLYFESAVL